MTAGVIAGIVSYLIAYLVTKALDYGSSKTNGLFGYNAARKDVEEIDGPKVREQTFRIHGNKTADDASSDSSQDAKVRLSAVLSWEHCEITCTVSLDPLWADCLEDLVMTSVDERD